MKRKTWVLAGVAALVAVASGVVAMSSARQKAPSAQETPVNTAKVERGRLAGMVSQAGTLTYRARPDGSPYAVINHASGTYTELPESGDRVNCGDVLYRVDNQPVLLLCGTVPAYRDLQTGNAGPDVRQLNQNLHTLGYDAGIDIDPGSRFHLVFTQNTQKALEQLQRDKGLDVTGALAVNDAVFLPGPLRTAQVSGQLGGPAQPNTPVLYATSDTLEVQLALDPSQQGEVKVGDRARVTLPDNRSVTGAVDRIGRVAHAPAGAGASAGAATIPASIRLDDPQAAGGLDQAPAQVDITTGGVENALSVPVVALVGKSGGGFAVEAVRSGGRRELVAVKLGLFDTGGGRVQVEGDLHAGDQVVVPSL